MAFIDYSAANVALPVLQKDLDATMAQSQWVVEIYILFVASLILVGGSMGDFFGRRKIFALGIVLFACASLLCGVAPNVQFLILARAFQGIGGALLIPGSLALLRASFPETESGRAIGTWSGFSALTSVIGPWLGGFLIQHFSWRWIFYINLPIAVITLAILHFKVDESRSDTGARRLDYTGALLDVVGLGLVVYALIEAGHSGLGDFTARWTFVAGLAVLALFVLHERRTPQPMMPLHLFASRTFTGVNLLTLLLYGALFGVMFYTQFLLLQVQGYSPLQAGAFFSPFAVIMFFFSRHAGRLGDRTGPRLPLTIGPLLTALSILMYARAERESSYWTVYLPAILVQAAGMTLVVAPLTSTAMNSVAERYAGVASGVNNAISRAGGLLAIALLGIVLQFGFNAELDRRLADFDLSPELRAALDRERPELAAAEIPAGPGAAERRALKIAVHESFLTGYRHMLYVCAALTCAGALLAFVLVEKKREDPPAPGDSSRGA